MPWKETSVMDERMKFVGRLLSGEKMAPLCREFGISRVTGHKIWNRYQQDGSRARLYAIKGGKGRWLYAIKGGKGRWLYAIKGGKGR